MHKVKDREVNKVKDKVHKVEKKVTREVGKDMVGSKIQGQI